MSHIKQIDRYIIRRLLGGGGMSTVYVAYDPQVDAQVAVKVLRTGMSDDPDMRERFEREARMLAKLRHPAIMPLLDYGEADGRLYFVMPYMHNGSLQERLLSGAMPFDEALVVLRRISLALDVAHSRSIIHRDIKPHNIIFDDDGMAFLADFGIARLVDINKPQQTVTLVGTPEYMAPEQVIESSISPQTDIYQLGVVLFQMLSGRRPFEGSVHSIMTQHLNDPPPLVESLMPGLPAGVDAVLGKALAKDAAERYGTIGEFSAAVMALQHNQPRKISEEHTIVVPPLFSAESRPAPPLPEPIRVDTATPALTAQPVAHRLKQLLWVSMFIGGMFLLLAVSILDNGRRGRSLFGAEPVAPLVIDDAVDGVEVTDAALINLIEAVETDVATDEQSTTDETIVSVAAQAGGTNGIDDDLYRSGTDATDEAAMPELTILDARGETVAELDTDDATTPELATVEPDSESAEIVAIDPQSQPADAPIVDAVETSAADAAPPVVVEVVTTEPTAEAIAANTEAATKVEAGVAQMNSVVVSEEAADVFSAETDVNVAIAESVADDETAVAVQPPPPPPPADEPGEPEDDGNDRRAEDGRGGQNGGNGQNGDGGQNDGNGRGGRNNGGGRGN